MTATSAESEMTDATARDELARGLLNSGYDDLNPIQKSVIDLIITETPSRAAPGLTRDERTFGQRLADRVAAFGGSWAFIIGFGVALLLWTGWNWAGKTLGVAFDPYPFIFLNLLLSTLAALQAPVIMMSQNRQSVTDRKAAEYDYVVNLRAELEILRLHDKLDALRGEELMALILAQNDRLDRMTREIAALTAGRS
jgi:uncharacterized membrane protein